MPYLCRAKMKRRFRLAARTHASHAWNTGSIPVGATKRHPNGCLFFLFVLFVDELLWVSDFVGGLLCLCVGTTRLATAALYYSTLLQE